MIKAITFDFWSTLYVNRESANKFRSRILFLQHAINRYRTIPFPVEEIEAAVMVAREAWDRTWVLEHRTIGAGEWLAVMLKALKTSLTADQRGQIEAAIENSIFDHRPTPVIEAEIIIPVLAERYALAVISDTGLTPGRALRQILQEDGLADCFRHLTFSDETGFSKPHPQAFLSTLAALGVEPGQAVHVGDLLRTDIAGAQQAGMRGVQYTGVNQDQARVAVEPDAIINSHAELDPLLTNWNRI